MSKENIAKVEKNGKIIRITFDTRDGDKRTYEYKGNSAAAIRRGVDPARLKGGKEV